ncbi:DUF418 domain-containing protein [Staphylococcus edaphicus]|uniref:DUF418 domain-containing protein n=2 Tax=Staphylococcus edaphicus TaxID=1955013 RepID=A0A2C6WLZ2_9STAP|nr:DUF418 domain-containing protein [Staphylococcus edaphicus]PHK50120.1 hypothetical protein BTJ66_05055 [Staphylococcus edaphicus]
MNNHRIVGLDIIRGLAICIVIFVNMHEVLPIIKGTKPHFSDTDKWIDSIFKIVINEKFISLFTILFGIGMGIFINNAKQKHLSPLMLMFRRLIFLLVIGLPLVIYELPFVGYALYGMIIMFATLIKRKWIILCLATLSIAYTLGNTFIYHSSSLNILFLMLFGLYMSESKKIYDIRKHVKFFFTTFCISLVTLLIIISLYLLDMSNWQTTLSLSAPLQTIIYFIVLLYLTLLTPVQKLLKPFENVGKMAFTLFILQILSIIITLKLTGINYPTPTESLLYGFPILLLMIIISSLWLAKFNQGPLEKLWRKWTYKNVKR